VTHFEIAFYKSLVFTNAKGSDVIEHISLDEISEYRLPYPMVVLSLDK